MLIKPTAIDVVVARCRSLRSLNYNRKQLLDSVFVISGTIIKVEVGKCYMPRTNIVVSHQALVDELEQRISQCHTKGMEDEEDYERASKALGAATGANKAKRSVNSPAGKYSQHG